MLCSLLSRTGIAGRPAEYFGQTLWEEMMNNRVLKAGDTRDFMDAVIEASTTPNGIFGTKLPANHAGMFLRRASEDAGRPFASLREALETTFPNLKYLLLTRDNKVAQAVSLYRAVMSGQWRREENGASGDQPTAVPYDPFAIQRCYQDIVASDAYWNAFFTAHGLSPFTLTYEELASDYEVATRKLLKYLGLPWHIEIGGPKTFKIADEQSAAWEKEFRKNGRLPAPEPGLRPETFWAPF